MRDEAATVATQNRLARIQASISRRPSRDDIVHSQAVQAMELANTDARRKIFQDWTGGTNIA